MIRALLIGILLLLLARAFWRLLDGVIEAAGGTTRRGAERAQRSARAAQAVKLVRDPVCGTFVAPASALALPSPSGVAYFCSERCRDEFKSQRAG